MNKIFINSVDFTEWVIGLDEFTVTVERSDSGGIDQSTSNTIRVIREGYEIFKAFFFDEICTAQDKILEATIKLDCCDTDFTYDIYFKGCAFLDYDCEARVSMIQRSSEKDAFEKLTGSPFWSDKYTYVNDAISAGMVLRMRDGQPLVADNGQHILDVRGLSIADPLAFESDINQWPGVVTVGVFAHQKASVCRLGTAQGVKTLTY